MGSPYVMNRRPNLRGYPQTVPVLCHLTVCEAIHSRVTIVFVLGELLGTFGCLWPLSEGFCLSSEWLAIDKGPWWATEGMGLDGSLLICSSA